MKPDRPSSDTEQLVSGTLLLEAVEEHVGVHPQEVLQSVSERRRT